VPEALSRKRATSRSTQDSSEDSKVSDLVTDPETGEAIMANTGQVVQEESTSHCVKKNSAHLALKKQTNGQEQEEVLLRSLVMT
jgi:topoisomerase IA-like protein